jgi:hypothetical protein
LERRLSGPHSKSRCTGEEKIPDIWKSEMFKRKTKIKMEHQVRKYVTLED